ncbi:MAG: hypothetical protein HY457_02375 [Parcubacteria group bacterium]|nr:hypothetical protein [Parcubacteria group bacterium]
MHYIGHGVVWLSVLALFFFTPPQVEKDLLTPSLASPSASVILAQIDEDCPDCFGDTGGGGGGAGDIGGDVVDDDCPDCFGDTGGGGTTDGNTGGDGGGANTTGGTDDCPDCFGDTGGGDTGGVGVDITGGTDDTRGGGGFFGFLNDIADAIGNTITNIGQGIADAFGGGRSSGEGEGRVGGEFGGIGDAPTSPLEVAWNAPPVGRGTEGCPLAECSLVSRSFVTESGERAVVYQGINRDGELVYITPVTPSQGGDAPGGPEPTCFLGICLPCPDCDTTTETDTVTVTETVTDPETGTVTTTETVTNTETGTVTVTETVTDPETGTVTTTETVTNTETGTVVVTETVTGGTGGTSGAGGTSGSTGGTGTDSQGICIGSFCFGGSSCEFPPDGCTSDPNACGQVNHGITSCDGSCNAPTPPNSNCPRPTISFDASPDFVERGARCTLTWSAQDASSCTITGVGVNHTGGPSGSTMTQGLNRQETYTIRCINNDPEVYKSAQTTCRLSPEFEEI